MQSTSDLEAVARKLRSHAVRMVHRSKASHLGSCLSMTEIITCLYWHALKVDPQNKDLPTRDRFILSKGHGAAMLYSALAEKGFIGTDELDRYCEAGSRLTGHVTSGVPGVELSSGSLGHGLPVGCGIALAAKREDLGFRTFVLLSDGELDEGSNWEAFLFAPQHQLDNLVVIIDYNKIQSFGRVSDVLELEPLAEKFRAFRWAVREVDGHNLQELVSTFDALPLQKGMPSVILAHTVKGKGISFMENDLSWHYKSPTAEQVQLAYAELGVNQ
ncbi:MAG: transketolase [Acidobacteriota bacterium]|nr:transketolase [Acidobacteriota bacterium]